MSRTAGARRRTRAADDTRSSCGAHAGIERPAAGALAAPRSNATSWRVGSSRRSPTSDARSFGTFVGTTRRRRQSDGPMLTRHATSGSYSTSAVYGPLATAGAAGKREHGDSGTAESTLGTYQLKYFSQFL